MKEIEKVLIVGAGAIGAAIGSMIHEFSPESVAVLAQGERFDRYCRDGFLVNGKKYPFHIVAPRIVPAAASETGGPFFDLIIVAVKHHHLAQAVEQMSGYTGPETTILSLMNGISSEETLGAAFGPGPGAPPDTGIPPYGMIIGIDAMRRENEIRFASNGTIFYGEKLNPPGNHSDRTARIARFFNKTGISFQIPENMLRTLWYKFMINVGINQASAVLRASYGIFQNHPQARAAMTAPMREVIALSRAMNINLDEGDLQNWEKTLAGLHQENLTSMCQDILAGRKTEVELFAGTMRELGQKYGVPTPANELYYNLIKAMEENFPV